MNFVSCKKLSQFVCMRYYLQRASKILGAAHALGILHNEVDVSRVVGSVVAYRQPGKKKIYG